MTRHSGTGKSTIYDLRSISIKNYKESGIFYDGYFGNRKYQDGSNYNIYISLDDSPEKAHIKLFYYIKGKLFDYNIYLEKVKCNFGGFKYYFICPKLKIRTTSLYMGIEGFYLSRKALNLCYQTQLYGKKQRAINKLFNGHDAEEIEKTIKYYFRNGKPTKKYLKVLKLRDTSLSKKEYSYFID